MIASLISPTKIISGSCRSIALPEKDEKKEFWEGYFLGYDSSMVNKIKQLFKFDDVIEYSNIFDYISNTLLSTKLNKLNLIWFEHLKTKKVLKDSHYQFKLQLERYFSNKKHFIQIENCWDSLSFRLCLDDIDFNNCKYANFLAEKVFKTTCSHLLSCETETNVAGILKGTIYKYCSLGQSFPAIIAAGKNASILHYQKNNSPLEKDSLLLLDFGCRYQNVVSDISRTIPVSGTFNPLQRLLYSIVLAAQKKVESILRAGITIDELNETCWTFIESELDRYFSKSKGSFTRSYDFSPHNVSHLIAHSVHDGDPFRLYRSEPLQKGMIISNEPGLYGNFELEINGNFYRDHCGIRIEDNLYITELGCINLSTSIPKEIDEIEQLIS